MSSSYKVYKTDSPLCTDHCVLASNRTPSEWYGSLFSLAVTVTVLLAPLFDTDSNLNCLWQFLDKVHDNTT